MSPQPVLDPPIGSVQISASLFQSTASITESELDDDLSSYDSNATSSSFEDEDQYMADTEEDEGAQLVESPAHGHFYDYQEGISVESSTASFVTDGNSDYPVNDEDLPVMETSSTEPDSPTLHTTAATLPPPHTPPIIQHAPPNHNAMHALSSNPVTMAAGNFDGDHPFVITNPNQTNGVSVAPENFGLFDFLREWEWEHRTFPTAPQRWPRAPCLREIDEQFAADTQHVRYSDLEADACDFQGLNWQNLGVTRTEARARRLEKFKNFTNMAGSDQLSGVVDRGIPSTEDYLRFRGMHIRRNVLLTHFQLRNIFACSSRNQVFYPGQTMVHEMNPVTGHSRTGLDLSNDDRVIPVTTLAANHDVLVVGGYYGEYRYRWLGSEWDDYTSGQLTEDMNSGITNYVQIHQSRSSDSPLAAFASNEKGFRVLDLATDKFVLETFYQFPINCSVMSPDRRLRAMVGDHTGVLITHADTGEILQELEGHRDFGFACDWAPDGWTVATAFQDRGIRIWDARMWKDSRGTSRPVEVIRTEMVGARCLKFSPLGSGKRVLVAAEESDVINIIDAQTYATKQTIDIFGELGGVAFANGGQELLALACDRVRGGVLQFDRCAGGTEAHFSLVESTNPYKKPRREYSSDQSWWVGQNWRRRGGYDWKDKTRDIVQSVEAEGSITKRRRRAAVLRNMESF